MRIIIDYSTNDPSLPLVDPAMALINDSVLGIWPMLSAGDSSGNGNNILFGGSFNGQGAVLANDPGSILSLPVAEQDDMTFIACLNIAAPGAGNGAASLLGNLAPNAAPFEGFRASIQENGFVQLTAATGATTPPVTNSSPTNISGAWTLRAFRFSNTAMQHVTGAGVVTTTAISAGRAKSTRPIEFNGRSVASGASITRGLNGTLGFLAMYRSLLSDAELIEKMGVVRSIMAGRGVIVP